MPGGRPKFNFYAVVNGREIGIYTNWPQTGDSVLGFAKAKYKGYATYSEARLAMENAGISDFKVFDGQTTYSKDDYENGRGKQTYLTAKDTDRTDTDVESICQNGEEGFEIQTATVYIDGSCIKNGSDSAKAGYGLYWGDNHPWNGSYALSSEEGAINNKAELKAAIKAIEIAKENHIDVLFINSDSKYVVSGATEWSWNWSKNGWRTSTGEPVKNKEEWVQLLNLIQSSEMSVSWKHVPGHSGIPGNEEADRLAFQGATQTCNPAKDTTPSSKTQPKVIVISKKQDPNSNQDVLIVTEQQASTPNGKLISNHMDTPVPGSINGSSVNSETTRARTQSPAKTMKDSNISAIDNNQLIQVMKNMEAVLETVLLEIHNSREEYAAFKQDVNTRLTEISSKQQDFSESLSCITNELTSEMSKHVNQLDRKDTTSASQTASVCARSFSEVQTGISNLQRGFNSRLEGMKSSLHTVEDSCSGLKREVEKSSSEHKKEYENIQIVSRQLFEAISDIKKENKRTREQMGDIEKSMNAISATEDFHHPTKIKEKKKYKEAATQSTENDDDNKEEEDDCEIIFPKKTTKEQNSSEADHVEQRSPTKKRNDTVSENTNSKSPDRGKQDGFRYTRNRKKQVYLIGDSIAGQINVPMLGKSTNTYVKRITASKLQDIEKHTQDITDARVVIIHTGINNLRDKEDIDSCMNLTVEAVNSMKEAAPSAKIVISKLIPIEDRELYIDGMLLNAKCEKKLREIYGSEVMFIDNSNFAEQGAPITKYFREDKLHLSNRGSLEFGNNLKQELNYILNQSGHENKIHETDRPEGRKATSFGKRYQYNYSRHGDRDHIRSRSWDRRTYNIDRRTEEKQRYGRYTSHHKDYHNEISKRKAYYDNCDYNYDDQEGRSSRYYNNRNNMNYSKSYNYWRYENSPHPYHHDNYDDNDRHYRSNYRI